MTLKVNFSDWRTENKDELTTLVRNVLGKSLRAKEISSVSCFDCYHDGYRSSARNKGVFRVYTTATPIQDFQVLDYPSARMWDYAVSRMRLYQPSGKGIVIVEPNSYYAVAELIEDDLYILFDLNSGNFSNASRLGIYTRIFEELIKLIGVGIPNLAGLLDGKADIPNGETLKMMASDLGQHRNRIASLVNEAQGLELQLKKLTMGDTGSDKVIRTIYSIPEIKTLDIRDGKMIIETHKMYGVHPSTNRIHEYGNFRIVLSFGREADAEFRNITRRPQVTCFGPGEYGHPHVDRLGGQWCHGEGRGIITLLTQFEFEAAILFALKAIDSVNPSRQGNYLDVLEAFPTVKEREVYPKKDKEIDRELLSLFAKIFRSNISTDVSKIKAKIKNLREEISKEQEEIAVGALAHALKLVGERKKDQKKQFDKISKNLNVQVQNISGMKGVKSVLVDDNTFRVRTFKLRSRDLTTGKDYLLGSFDITFDIGSGSIRVKNDFPLRASDGTETQAPQLTGEEGELPLGQLTATLPELLGGLELETSVSLVLDFLSSFKSADIGENVLSSMAVA